MSEECPCCGNESLNEPLELTGMECAVCGTRWCWGMQLDSPLPDFMLSPERRARRYQELPKGERGDG